MKAHLEIDPGVCGFATVVVGECGDMQHVAFEVTSGCEKVAQLASRLRELGPVDAFAEISPGSESAIFAVSAEFQKGCCRACAVTLGIYKAMQVAAGLALPREISIRISKEQ